ncbi:MAG TPA: hypothetical protein VMS22_10945 [Candidatus Eisenbacteria bacterium]|nr:hypothetical protein [Candidatus Eisenbacteria bacterium]
MAAATAMRRLLAGVTFALGLLACTASATDLHSVTGFDEFAEEHPRIGADLRRQPALAGDAEYLRRHPSLGGFLRDHPNAHVELEEEEPTPLPQKTAPAADEENPKRTAHHATHSIFENPLDDDD